MTRNARAAAARPLTPRAPGTKWLSGASLRDIRKSAPGRTQAAVAAAVGADPANICHWEAGRFGCDLDTVVRLAAFFGCPVTDLMHDAGRARYAALTAGTIIAAKPDAA